MQRALNALRCPPGDALISNLSGGELRRVALCRLLLQVCCHCKCLGLEFSRHSSSSQFNFTSVDTHFSGYFRLAGLFEDLITAHRFQIQTLNDCSGRLLCISVSRHILVLRKLIKAETTKLVQAIFVESSMPRMP